MPVELDYAEGSRPRAARAFLVVSLLGAGIILGFWCFVRGTFIAFPLLWRDLFVMVMPYGPGVVRSVGTPPALVSYRWIFAIPWWMLLTPFALYVLWFTLRELRRHFR